VSCRFGVGSGGGGIIGQVELGACLSGRGGIFSAPFFIWFFLLTDSSTSGKTRLLFNQRKEKEHV
jgi:hypothetical protein